MSMGTDTPRSTLSVVRLIKQGQPRRHDDMKIVQALADGARLYSIAGMLKTTTNVVQVVLMRIRKDHRVKTNSQLVAHYMRNGWID